MARRDPNARVFDDVRRILHADWDQTGAPEDEYDTYAGRAYRMLVDGADATSITAYLDEAGRAEILVATSQTKNFDIATRIIALRELLV